LKDLNLISFQKDNKTLKCPICVEAKYSKRTFKQVAYRSTSLLELVHSDLADFKNCTSRGGNNYYISFVDDFSRYTKIYLLKSKDEAESAFLKYKAEVENQLDIKIKRIRSDRGGEYSPKTLAKFCDEHSIIHEASAPYTPQQNGIAERKNRTLKEMMNAMLICSGLSSSMWGEAILSACFVLNRVPHKKLEKTPFDLWKGYSPNLSFSKSWGCLAKVLFPDFKRPTIGPKTFDCVFIVYALDSATYRFMSLNDNSICESRDAVFFEDTFLCRGETSNKQELERSAIAERALPLNKERAPLGTAESSLPVLPQVEPRRSKRKRIESSFGPDFLTNFFC
jgi:integrase-like protein